MQFYIPLWSKTFLPASVLASKMVLAGDLAQEACAPGISGKLAGMDVVVLNHQLSFRANTQNTEPEIPGLTSAVAMNETMQKHGISEVILSPGQLSIIPDSNTTEITILIPGITPTTVFTVQPSGIPAIDQSSSILTLLNSRSLSTISTLVSKVTYVPGEKSHSSPETTPTPALYKDEYDDWFTHDPIPTPEPSVSFTDGQQEKIVAMDFADERITLTPSCTCKRSSQMGYSFTVQPVVASTNSGQESGSTSTTSEQTTSSAPAATATPMQPGGSPPRKKRTISAVGPLVKKPQKPLPPERLKESRQVVVIDPPLENTSQDSKEEGASIPPEGITEFLASISTTREEWQARNPTKPRQISEARKEKQKARVEDFIRKKKKERWEKKHLKDEERQIQPPDSPQEPSPADTEISDTQPQPAKQLLFMFRPRALTKPRK